MNDILPRLKRHALAIGVIIALALVFWAEWSTASTFFAEMISWGAQAAIILAWVMVLEWAVKLLLSMQVFDANGSGTEMQMLRERLGTPGEARGDPLAVGVSYAAVWVFRAVLALSFFLHHG